MYITKTEETSRLLKTIFGYLGLGNYDLELYELADHYNVIISLKRKMNIDDLREKNPQQIADLFKNEIMNNPIFQGQLKDKDREIVELKKEIEEIKNKALNKAIS